MFNRKKLEKLRKDIQLVKEEGIKYHHEADNNFVKHASRFYLLESRFDALLSHLELRIYSDPQLKVKSLKYT